MGILKYNYTITYEASIDSVTGEVIETKIVNKSSPKKLKAPIEDSSEPILTLEENKYKLSSSAVALMGLNESSRLVIKYEDTKTGAIPIIGTAQAFGMTSGGNKLSKSNTVACRGGGNSELAKYGSEFTIIPHATKEGLYVLKSNNPPVIEETLEEDSPLDLDIDSNLLDDPDTNITEIDPSFFRF